MARRFAAILISACASLLLQGQDVLGPDGPCRGDGVVRPYAPLREADAIWSRRVWRVIDLSEAANQLLAKPAAKGPGCRNLIEVISHGLRDEGGIRAFLPGKDGHDDGFRSSMSRDMLLQELDTLDALPSGAVGRFMLKEDWVFDKARSVMEVRIIGLAPMIEVRGELGELRGYRPMFWLYYPECRQLFAWWVAGMGPEGSPVTFEAILDGRLFRGAISKVSNMHDRSINATASGIDALIEGEAVREQLRRIGFDLWNH
jgi:gliding motility associated protien GldN